MSYSTDFYIGLCLCKSENLKNFYSYKLGVPIEVQDIVKSMRRDKDFVLSKLRF